MTNLKHIRECVNDPRVGNQILVNFVPPLLDECDRLRAALKEACDWWDSHLKGFEKRHGGDAGSRLERRTLDSLLKLTDEPTEGEARGELQIETYCSACHRQVKSCDHALEEREAWRHETAFEPWQRQTAPGTYGLCPHCASPTVTLFGDRAGRCYACGKTNEQLVAKLKEQAEATRGVS